jgi:hypothetical protein
MTPTRLLLLPLLAAASITAAAQGLPPGTVVTRGAITGFGQFDTDLDSGGSFSWEAIAVSGEVLRQFTPQLAAGLSLRYEYENWSFSDPKKFAGRAPWDNVNLPQVGASFVYTPAPDWTVLFAPAVEWSYEQGASTSDAINYGAVLVASRRFSPTLTLGAGAAVFRQLDETKTFPFIAIDWKINDQWTLTNPLPAGPMGGAGLELTYEPGNGWEAGFGGAYRSYQFRLDRNGPVPDGIGEQRFIPLFVRLSRDFGATSVDLYAAALVNGRLTVKNANGIELASEDYGTAPALGLSLRHRF